MSRLQRLAEPAFEGLTTDHEDFRGSLRPLLERVSPEAEVRRLMATETGFDPVAWQQLADQVGLPGLTIPEEYGGSGFGYLELGVVLEELGRAVACTPYFATVVLATNALLLGGDDAAKADLLPGIAAGTTVATVAVTEPNGSWRPADLAMIARPDGAAWALDGTKSFVLDGISASLILVAAWIDDGLSLFAVESPAPGLTRTPLATMDQTRKQAVLEFAGTPARLIGSPGGFGAILEKWLDLAAVALAAEQVGGAQRCLEMSVDYAKIREQFGRPIGSYQSIKHKCADMLIQVESARAAAHYALEAAATDSPQLPAIASLAKAHCSEAYSFVAGETIHIHGGIGFTWEHSAHLYFKRATSSELLLGDPDRHRDAFADRIGLHP
jgi:alkylation response protein AidB-like acyl-CoA dehydrogenase